MLRQARCEMRAAVAALLLAGASARAEEIRIEIARGPRSVRLGAHAVAARGEQVLLDGEPVAAPLPATAPVQLDGRELPGRGGGGGGERAPGGVAARRHEDDRQG